MWTVDFQMFKLVLEKAEEPEIKLPTSAGSLKKQESMVEMASMRHMSRQVSSGSAGEYQADEEEVSRGSAGEKA